MFDVEYGLYDELCTSPQLWRAKAAYILFDCKIIVLFTFIF